MGARGRVLPGENGQRCFLIAHIFRNFFKPLREIGPYVGRVCRALPPQGDGGLSLESSVLLRDRQEEDPVSRASLTVAI